jgi:competence ComEA-like helix-hairpin-helix protein
MLRVIGKTEPCALGVMKRAAIGAVLFALCCSAVMAQTKQPPAHPLDLNFATAEQLQQVPGIGPKTAEAIVNFRQKSGPFRRVEDLLAIKGISQSKLDRMRPYLKVTPPPQRQKSPEPTASQALFARPGSLR